jgi:hypothetical protein
LFQRLNGLRQRVDHLDWSANFIDSTTIPVHHKATGGPPFSEAIGISRGGLTTKVHVRVDREGRLLNVEVTEGQHQELAVYKKLMNNGAVQIPWGRPKLRPEAVVDDKEYNAGWADDWNHRKHGLSVFKIRQPNEKRTLLQGLIPGVQPRGADHRTPHRFSARGVPLQKSSEAL